MLIIQLFLKMFAKISGDVARHVHFWFLRPCVVYQNKQLTT